MATKSTKAAGTVETTEASEPTLQHIVNDGIVKVIEAHDIDAQKARYKAMRAIAWQAFVESVESGDFDELVQRAIANVDSLPSGWGIEASATRAAEPAAVKAAARAKRVAKPTPAKAATTTAKAAR